MRALWFARYFTAGEKVVRRVEDFRPDVIEFSFLTIEYKLTRMFQEQFADLCPGATVIIGGVVFFFVVLVQEGFRALDLFDRIPALLLIALLVSVGTQMFFFGLVLELLRQIGRQVDHIRSTSDSD